LKGNNWTGKQSHHHDSKEESGRTHNPNPPKRNFRKKQEAGAPLMMQNTIKEPAFAGKSQHPTIPTNKKPKEYMSRDPQPLLFAFHQPPVNNNHSASPIPSTDKSQSAPKDGSSKQTAYQKWNGNRSSMG
jgi:hypothetical protein